MGSFFVISMTYAGIAGLAVFVLSLSMNDGGARMPPAMNLFRRRRCQHEL
jgi:hypothetical protein